MTSDQQNSPRPVITASEVAGFVYCPHAWYLHQQGAVVTREAEQWRKEGLDWQDRMDSIVPSALDTERKAQDKSRQAALVFWMLTVILGCLALYISSVSRH